VVVGRSGRAPASGAIAATSGAESENLATRAGDSLVSANLETGTPGIDAIGAFARGSVCTHPVDDGRDISPWATRCTAGDSATEGSISGSAEEIALSWTDGTSTISLLLWGRVRRGLRPSGKSNRGASLASNDGARETSIADRLPEEASIGEGVWVEASIGSLPLWETVGRGRSTAARCRLRSGTGATSAASSGSRASVEASIDFLCRSGSSVAARCTLRSGTRVIGAPSPMRRDWPRVSRCSGADDVSDAASPKPDIVKGVCPAIERCATG
jgi:hypothetical protein